ncbi:MAG: tail fiber domain-containing protein [Muribaculaceae bacterium]|nr:tail fiber domain-containing protein [Muribaculaceae bacterium]
MKKIIFTILSLTAITVGSNAQLRILNNGHTQIGFNGLYPSYKPDTTSTLSLIGQMPECSGALLTFGTGKHVSIGESNIVPNSLVLGKKTGAMLLTGLGGIKYTSYYGDVFSYTPTDRIVVDVETGERSHDYGTFTFNVKVTAKQYLTLSDARYKKNIHSLENAGAKLNLLTPVSYNLSVEDMTGTIDEMQQTKNSKVSSPADVSSNSALNYGFIAQEVKEVYPDLVYENEDGMLAIDYNGFIPLLVDRIKTLDAKVTEQEEMIYSLTSGAKKIRSTAGVEELYGEEKIVLLQNRPNPFKSSTEIKCYLPQEVSEAFICIYDLNGRQQMRLDIRDRGDVAVTVSGSSLQPGMYIYSLIADGQEADSKRMILTE